MMIFFKTGCLYKNKKKAEGGKAEGIKPEG
jgi:hypothetical protein